MKPKFEFKIAPPYFQAPGGQCLQLVGINEGLSPYEGVLARAFLSTVLVRHFTSHFFDAYEGILKNERLYKELFQSTMSSFLYTLDTVA